MTTITCALEWDRTERQRHEKKDTILRLLERQTDGKRDVCKFLSDRHTSKVVAYEFGI